jgi:hypothetical protein
MDSVDMKKYKSGSRWVSRTVTPSGLGDFFQNTGVSPAIRRQRQALLKRRAKREL